MLAALRLCQPELAPAGDDLTLVLDVSNDGVTQVYLARHPIDQGHHVDGEGGLELGHLEQVVLHHQGVGVALERDDQVGFAARRCVVDVGDSVEVSAIDEVLDPRSD